jgi:excisionase family DNA binding protein
MNVKEAAQHLGKSDATVRRWIRQGKLSGILVGGKYDIEESTLDALIKPKEHMGDACEEREFIELECLLSQNTELSRRIATQETTIQNQKAIIEQLRTPLTVTEKRSEKTGHTYGITSAQDIDIGTYTRRYNNGEVIIAEGDTDRDMYFVVSGRAEISQYVAGKRMVVTTLKSGDFFGEMALLTGCSRSMTVMAKGDVYLWRMSSAELHEYMQLYPQVAIDMCIRMSERLGYTNLLLRDSANRIVTKDGDEYDQTTTLNYLWQKLNEKNEQLQGRDKQIDQLREQVKLLTPSPFLRGLDRKNRRRSILITHPDS